MNRQLRVLTGMLLLLPTVLFAQSSARDTDIDTQLNAAALNGIAPVTGNQALPLAPANAPQKFIDPYLPALMQTGAVILGQTDGKARVYEVKGDAYLIKKGSPLETKLKKGMILQADDTIRTEAGSSVSVAFDENYKNAVHIPGNSQAVLESIEPTNIRVENGSVFSAVDGLPQGSTWKVSTPVAVAAVRGTLYVVRFQAADGRFFAATVNVPDDGKSSSIDIQEIIGDDSANVPEGKQIELTQGQSPSDDLVQELNPSVLDEILKFFEELIKLRDQNNNNTPPTGSGSVGGTNLLDPAGPGVIGGSSGDLDIIDTGSITEPLPDENISESSSGYGNEEFPCYGECD